MLIQIPKFITEHHDEGTMLLAAFLYRVAKEETHFTKTRYYLQGADARYFLRRFITRPYTIFAGYDKWIRIGSIGDDVWVVDWLQKPECVEYDLTNPELCAIWGYVLGRESVVYLSEECEEHPQPADTLLNREDRRFLKYTAQETREKDL